MPSSTIYCKITFARGDYSLRHAFLRVGNLVDVKCILPMNRVGLLTVSNINILGRPYTWRRCVTYCFKVSDIRIVCPGAVQEFDTTRSALLLVNKATHFEVVDTNIGNINYYNLKSVVETYYYDNLPCVAVARDETSNNVLCFVLIAATTDFDLIPVDVGYQMRAALNCIVQGELYTTLNCQIVTQTKRSDRGCVVHMATEPDAFTQILCRIPRLIGDPVEYVSVEVVLGKRFIGDVRCTTVVPPDNYDDVQCTTSPVLAGQPRWNRFDIADGIVARLMNIGAMEITSAVLQDNERSLDASKIERISSMWQVQFLNIDKDMSSNYVIVVTIEPGHKVVVIDKPKGEFSL